MARDVYDNCHEFKLSELNSWKKLDIKEFPGTDPRLPYEFDLHYDLKHWSDLYKIMNKISENVECLEMGDIKGIISLLEDGSIWEGCSVSLEMRNGCVKELFDNLHEKIKKHKKHLKRMENYLKSRKR